jgi:broad specificity phosphatase PhoE
MSDHPVPSENDEAAQRILDPHRQEEQGKAREESETRLADRGIEVHPDDNYDDVADLQDTIERFEAEVQRQGGDLMVNHIGTERPEDPDFVPPPRESGESIPAYLRRLEDALARLTARRTGGQPW